MYSLKKLGKKMDFSACLVAIFLAPRIFANKHFFCLALANFLSKGLSLLVGDKGEEGGKNRDFCSEVLLEWPRF